LAGYRLTVLRASEEVENAFSTMIKQRARAQFLAEGNPSLGKARASSFAAYKGGVSSLSMCSTLIAVCLKFATLKFRREVPPRAPLSRPFVPSVADGCVHHLPNK
jgi:hypothetical protein